MAVRSQIGSSLVAKSNPGSPIRKTTEDKINNPAIPNKGAIGSIQRQAVEQPFLKETPSGSARTVSVTPAIESQAIGNRNMPIPEAAGGANGQPQLRSGANGQALFQGGVSTPSAVRSAAPVAKGGTAAKSASVAGVNKGAIGGMGMITPEAASTSINYERQGVFSGNPQLPSAMQVGSRVSASGDNQISNPQPGQVKQGNTIKFTPTTGQYIAGKVGSVLSSIPATQNLGNKLQTFGGAASPAATGQGSATNAIRSVIQTVSNILNKLRSLGK